MTAQRFTITALLAGLTLLFIAVLVLAVLREQPGSNSYVALADAFLHGQLHVNGCLDEDCALFHGKAYVVFPPLPALLITPFVAIFGTDFHYFLPLSLFAFAGTALLWWRMCDRLAESRDLRALMILLILFATPLIFVTIRGDHIWFFAQSWAFFFTTAALYATLVSRSALFAGLFIAAAFLCRQMSILYLPFLYVLLMEEERPLWHIDRAAFARALRLAAFPVAAVAAYLAYNWVRFGSPMETGYDYLFPISLDRPGYDPGFIKHRLRELGPFAVEYFPFNAFYMFFQGPHVEFMGRYLTELKAFDNNGASLFLVTPALLFAFLARWNRAFWIGLATCAFILGVTLFYHSNGFSQYSTQRYALDWLPIMLVFVALGLKREYAPPLAILIAYSMGTTLAMIAIGGLLAS
ncbi:hypothetical protein A7A08_00016 [Methyloligella halotolerans]|uniref:Glycosyltransferase RgtA/B/C/D-like domain-containing protein n=1 Tax=Methyloligella halotolerans TaxID=1177755 RepID=A0A1E2S1J0_9HYPH|nr:hypothetical protein [Methyloligella halotolerans]ODA68199.1 hypothetical protein A7A08_00016 [Methyloligella halotolerans]